MKEVANTPKKQNERRSLRKSARQVNMRKTLLLIFIVPLNLVLTRLKV